MDGDPGDRFNPGGIESRILRHRFHGGIDGDKQRDHGCGEDRRGKRWADPALYPGTDHATDDIADAFAVVDRRLSRVEYDPDDGACGGGAQPDVRHVLKCIYSRPLRGSVGEGARTIGVDRNICYGEMEDRAMAIKKHIQGKVEVLITANDISEATKKVIIKDHRETAAHCGCVDTYNYLHEKYGIDIDTLMDIVASTIIRPHCRSGGSSDDNNR